MRGLHLLIAFSGLIGLSGANMDTMLISTESLANNLANEKTIILHIGGHPDYAAGHIPGARLLSLSDISVTGERGLRLQLPPDDALLEALGRLGIDQDSRVVLYHGVDSPQSATRAWFTFDYLGLGDRVSLLDGGLKLWRAEGRTLSTETPVWTPKKMTARARPELVLDAAAIQARLDDPTFVLIDARAPEFYTGTSAGSMPRAGHIPRAVNTPFTGFFEDNGKLKPRDALKQLLGEAGPSPVTYCHIGQQATVPYFVARMLGLEPRLYDGSFQDWSMRPDLPVVGLPAAP